ncbi:MAG: hypothetical protein ACP5KW_07350 [Thermoproteota archaeon]
MMSEYKHYAEEMYKIEQTFEGKIPEEQKVDKVYSFFRIKHLVALLIGEVMLGILAFFSFAFIGYMLNSFLFEFVGYELNLGLNLPVYGTLFILILYPAMDYHSLNKSRNAIHKYYDLKKKFSPLIEFIHKDLSEVYRLKLRPETIEYKITADFSFKEGVFSIKCPNCRANVDISKDKIEGNKYKCPYCQTTIILPEKLLNLI